MNSISIIPLSSKVQIICSTDCFSSCIKRETDFLVPMFLINLNMVPLLRYGTRLPSWVCSGAYNLYNFSFRTPELYLINGISIDACNNLKICSNGKINDCSG